MARQEPTPIRWLSLRRYRFRLWLIKQAIERLAPRNGYNWRCRDGRLCTIGFYERSDEEG